MSQLITRPPVSVRAGTQADCDLIAATLQRSLIRTPRQFISQFVLENIHTATIACHPEHPEVILGFLLATRSRLAIHYIFVKPAFRRCGVAKVMMEEAFKMDRPRYFTLIAQEQPRPLIKRLKLQYCPLVMMVKDALL